MFLEDSFSSSPSESGKYKYGLLSRGQRNSIILKKKKSEESFNDGKSIGSWRNFASKKSLNTVAAAAAAAAAAAKSLQLCLTLCDPTDGSPPGSPSLGFSRQEHWSG